MILFHIDVGMPDRIGITKVKHAATEHDVNVLNASAAEFIAMEKIKLERHIHLEKLNVIAFKT
jgi:hypothetical protein